MYIKKGLDRIVIVIPQVNLVVKLAKINLWSAFKPIFFRFGLNKNSWFYIRKYIAFPYYYDLSFQGFLLRGLCANWQEFRLYKRLKSPLLVPTYFSLFGLINIQRYMTIFELDHVDLWCQLYEMTNGQVFDHSHHFANPANFALEAGKLRMIDYGSRKCEKVITEYGDKIFNEFRPDYCWKLKNKN
jgi:hypothetical protein